MDNSLLSRLKKKQLQAAKLLTSHHPHAAKFLTTSALAGTLLLSAPSLLTSPSRIAVSSPLGLQNELIEGLTPILPETVGPIIPEQETEIAKILKKILGITVTAELNGNRLNQSYGFMGAEQHLPRFPGDTIDQHDEFQKSGITPGRGAWGYFANSKIELSPDLIQKEKYYVAVQTLYLPDWNTRQPEIKDWYKWRKVLVVNPKNGKSIVAIIGDAGPASWTGKHFGGSPEVMVHLGLNVGMQKGAVLLFFVDDPENNVPLGPT